jgi:hypothetical protein
MSETKEKDVMLIGEDDWKKLGAECITEEKFLRYTECLVEKQPDSLEKAATDFFQALPAKFVEETDLMGLVEEVMEDAIKDTPRHAKIGTRCARMWLSLGKIVDTSGYGFDTFLNTAMKYYAGDVLEWFVTSVATDSQCVGLREWIDEMDIEKYEKYKLQNLLAILKEALDEEEDEEDEEEGEEEEKKEEEKKEEEKKEEEKKEEEKKEEEKKEEEKKEEEKKEGEKI